MNGVFRYSFPDEPLYKFIYDESEKIIEMYFERFCDGNILIENSCVFIIKKWKNAETKVMDAETPYESFQNHIGIPDLILGVDIDRKNLILHICTKDFRFVSIRFVEAEWNVCKY